MFEMNGGNLIRMEPLVSIIIPVYNGENYMREAIDSALAQTYSNFEVLVINDGSTDKTDEIALSYADKIRYFKKENGGVSSALNKGIAEMKGEYFSWLSHDDAYAPDKIQKSVKALESCNDKNVLVCCRSVLIDKNSVPLKSKKKCTEDETKLISWEEALKELFEVGAYGGCNLLIPKNAFDICGGFDEDLRFIQDVVMWNKMFFKKFSVLKIPDVCVMSRIHSNQLTQTGQALLKTEMKKVSDYMISEYLKVSTKENNFIKLYTLNCAKNNIKSNVKKAILAAKGSGFITNFDKIEIFMMSCYGKVRPFIRRAYYKIFRNIKTS